MTRDEYLKELNKAFGDFKFYENGHYYTYKDKPIEIGATGLIEQYTQDFDSQAVAERVAERDNKSVQEVLDEWKQKNEWACEKGHLGHCYAQETWEQLYPSPIWFDDEEKRIAINRICNQADNFYNDYKDRLELVYNEYVIGGYEYNLASAIDALFINKLTGGLILVDYKTNSDIHKNERYAKQMKVPLSHLKDTTLNHYAIQLSIYKYLVEKYTNLKIEEMFIVWFSENIDNYEIIEIPYLKDEVIKILENRREKNMNSVPVLLIGQSGSGKSTSLRNFKGDEVAVVNVLGKPLPFKSDIKAGKCDDYAKILNAIAHTDKKTIVIDDANYLITNEFMNKSSVKGFDKYNEMGNNFFNLINGIKNIEGGKTVYLIMHEDTDENGNVKPKTIGKLLDDKVNIQGMFTICIRSMFDNGNYIFRLKTNGQDCVKTPFGMFEAESMENDLKEFDKVVREYYELDKEEK
jgi:hypothetical protein